MKGSGGLRITCLAFALTVCAVAVSTAANGIDGNAAPGAQPKVRAAHKNPSLRDRLAQRFTAQVQPFLRRYCVSCHGSHEPKGHLDLSHDTTMTAVVQNLARWQHVLKRLQAEQMPPDSAPRQPGAKDRTSVIAWIRDLRDRETRRTAGDPGTVLARRLSITEFDFTIRDLTGVDIRPTRDFPVDPANQAGFDNTGESLMMSPTLLKKYLAAARLVANHVVLLPKGFTFALHPVVTDSERDQYCVSRIIAFYKRHPVDYADYFLAALKYRDRKRVGRPDTDLSRFASEAGLSARYLALVWTALTDKAPEVGPLAEVRKRWHALPMWDREHAGAARATCEHLRDRVLRLRQEFRPQVGGPHVKGISDGSQPFVLWRDRELARRHRTYSGSDPAIQRFCSVFPDAFVVSDRAPYFDPKQAGQGRPLTAGFHLMQGYFRDDQPLCDLILNDRERRELDALWQELDFVTLAPIRQYKDFIFFERAEPPRFMFGPEFDFARSEDPDATSEAKMNRLAQAHLAKAHRLGASHEALKAIETYYRDISAAIRRVERARRAAEPGHLQALITFAERAYRRPLGTAERDGLRTFYNKLRRAEGLGHEDALRDTVVTVLLSPQFCYRLNFGEPGKTVCPLSDYELASRLSYFLWSSMPDTELLAHAAAGDLHEPAALTAQARRMLRDGRVRGLATEFVGNWLDFRRFEEHNAVDRRRFPSFTNELRKAMYEEPIHYFVNVVQRNRPVLDLLYGSDTFVNPVLARHYGMCVKAKSGWVHVDDAGRYGRGSLLTMAVFLTKNAPGLRTSPVKRGYWVVRRLLGEEIPPPPPTVPQLPKDEAKLGELTLPQLLARHRQDKSCSACHSRFDAVGVVFEGYGPIGECRSKDLSGHSVQTRALFPDGTERNALGGLRAYLHEKRQADFIDNLCRKLFAYALGRSLQMSDQPALDHMRARLAADGYRFDSLVDAIVQTPQFLNKRVR